MDLLNEVYIYEPMTSHIYEPNISLISLIILIFSYVKPRFLSKTVKKSAKYSFLLKSFEFLEIIFLAG